MSVETEQGPTALTTLRATLIARANAAAAHIRAQADADAQAVVSQAKDEAAAILAKARAEGEAAATVLLAGETARARQAARGIVLKAQLSAYDDLREHCSAAVRALLSDGDQQRSLGTAMGQRLGVDVSIAAAAGGGLVATTDDGRRVDASVAALVDRALAVVDLEQIWANR